MSGSVQVGGTVQLTSTVQDARGQALDGRTVTWESSDSTIASVSSTGLVTARAAGAARITATSETKSATATLTVTAPQVPPLPGPPAAVAAVAVAPARWSLSVGESVQLVATLQDARGATLSGRPVTWSSADPAVATVTVTGLVTAVQAGSTRITATSERKSGGAVVTVTAPLPPPPAPVTSVDVVPDRGTLRVGETVQLRAIPRDAVGASLSGRPVGWRTSQSAVATVSLGGLVTAVAPGSATITATSEGQSATVDVTVVPLPPPDTPGAPPVDRAAAAAEITATLNEFTKALESRQMTRVRRVYPDMGPAEQQRWKDLFESKDVTDWTVRLTRQDTPTVDDSTAAVSFAVTLGFRNPTAGRVVREIHYRATLLRASGGWRLTSLQD